MNRGQHGQPVPPPVNTQHQYTAIMPQMTNVTNFCDNISQVHSKRPHQGGENCGDADVDTAQHKRLCTNAGFLMSPGSRPTVSLSDGYRKDVGFVGEVHHGTVEKGYGAFNYQHRDGPFQGQTESYIGEFQNGFFEGHGVYRSLDGFVYEGEFHNSRFNGIGMSTFPSKIVYEGEFKNHRMNGRGICKWPNGNYYIGDWKDDRRDGIGKAFYTSGDIYHGEWKDDQKHGAGMLQSINGDRYEGEFHNGERCGKGKMYYQNGNVAEVDDKGDPFIFKEK